MMKVIAYYTNSGSYKKEKDLFRHSLRRIGMDHHIQEEKDGGDWYANTRIKPRFIQGMRAKFEGPLLYVDVDAFVHENCAAYFENLARLGADFGAHWFRGPAKGHDRSKIREEGWWMLSGTLFIGDTPGARRLVDTWCYLNDILFQQGVAEGGGQKNLWYLTTCMEDLSIAKIPGRYCYVFDKWWAYDPDEPVIIEHTIASRDHRSGVKRRTHARRGRIQELMNAILEERPALHIRPPVPPPPCASGPKVEIPIRSPLEIAQEERKKAGKILSAAKGRYSQAVATVNRVREGGA